MLRQMVVFLMVCVIDISNPLLVLDYLAMDGSRTNVTESPPSPFFLFFFTILNIIIDDNKKKKESVCGLKAAGL